MRSRMVFVAEPAGAHLHRQLPPESAGSQAGGGRQFHVTFTAVTIDLKQTFIFSLLIYYNFYFFKLKFVEVVLVPHD